MKDDISDENLIALICNGEFNAIRYFKIGELFESFFDNINYNVVRENNNEDIYVDFTGEAMCDDEPCTILIRFRVYDNIEEFEIDFVKVDDTLLNEEEIMDLLDDIAFAGGAVLDDEEYCYNCDLEDCEHCVRDANILEDDSEYDNLEDEEDYDDEDDDNDDENEYDNLDDDDDNDD